MINKINVKEFRQNGYLQELNRRFLHPLGLAIEVVVDDNNEETLGGIWDYRNDPVGIIYDLKNSDQERKDRFLKNEKFIDEEIKRRTKTRREKIGFFVEPIM